MSSPRYDWWSYVKAMLRRYPNKCNQNEKIAIEKAIEATRRLRGSEERVKLVEMMFFKQSHTMEGAAMALFISPRTAQRYHADFIREVGRNFSCDSLIADSVTDKPKLHEPQVIKSDLLRKLSPVQRKIIVLMVDLNMHQTNVGKSLGMTQGGVTGHLKTIKRRTGIDPRTFWGLTTLYEAIRKEDTDVH